MNTSLPTPSIRITELRLLAYLFMIGMAVGPSTHADIPILQSHCSECHSDASAEGEFRLTELGDQPADDNLGRWFQVLERVRAGEMPPTDAGHVTDREQEKLLRFLRDSLNAFRQQENHSSHIRPRRLNNREFQNSVRDVLLIDDIGTNQPTANLLGDSLHHGFDTHGDTLGFSKFHLEQYITAVRKIVDATILSGPRPQPNHIGVPPEKIFAEHFKQNIARSERRGIREGFDFLDPRQLGRLTGFETVPNTGFYRITIRATGKDRGIYAAEDSGMYPDDPIRLTVLMGDRRKVFDLPDEKIIEISLNEWLAEGTRFRLQHDTDGLKMRGNGNFKFQNAITGEYLRTADPDRYAAVLAARKPTRSGELRPPQAWHNWVDDWMGARPRILSVAVEGPHFDTWPPQRQVRLIGTDPNIRDAAAMLQPIAERAWRRQPRAGELDPIVELVQSKAKDLGNIEALKEGIVSILVSPQFLLLNTEDDGAGERFASKFSYFLSSTIPDDTLRQAVADGKLDSFAEVRAEVQRRVDQSKADDFLRAFPTAWLELNDINFMAPDPDQFRLYHRKDLSQDMIDEVLHFFRHAVEHNVSVPELLSADYSFVNADLAQIYDLDDVPQDSVFRKHTFDDGRRGGLLGMGAFLTLTADNLTTSPIHRAIYVMENFLGIQPTPPPPNVTIAEPDVRQATTIREVLEQHRSDTNCASCHQRIDPFGFAFENFDPSGAWRDVYPVTGEGDTPSKNRVAERKGIPIDASAEFNSVGRYSDIVEYRQLLLTSANRDRFVRCFVVKLLTYANGKEPDKLDFAEIDAIVEQSANHNYRIVDTIAAVIDSPLFREH